MTAYVLHDLCGSPAKTLDHATVDLSVDNPLVDQMSAVMA